MNNRNRRFMFRSGGSYHLYLDTNFSGFVQPHDHNFYQFLLVRTGQITQLQGGRKYSQRPGDLFFTPPGCEHSLYVFGDGTNYYCLSFSEEIADAVLSAFPTLKKDLSNFPAMLHAPDSALNFLHAIFELMLPRGESFVRDKGGSGPFLAGAAVAEAFGVAAEHTVESEEDAALHALDADEAIHEAIEYINTHFYEDITVESAAKRTAMSKSCFCKRFTAIAGVAPKRYITEKRMHEALRLLHDGDMPFNRIAEEVGYQDFSTFYRSFRRMTGCSPSEYRSGLPAMKELNEYHNRQL